MSNYSTSNIKNGLKVLINNDPYEIIDNSFHKPGKGQAFSKIKLKNLGNGRIIEKTLKIGDSLDSADIQVSVMQYLYNDDTSYFFMNTESFEQISLNREVLGDNSAWLKGQEICSVTFFNGNPIGIELPIFVELVAPAKFISIEKETSSSD